MRGSSEVSVEYLCSRTAVALDVKQDIDTISQVGRTSRASIAFADYRQRTPIGSTSTKPKLKVELLIERPSRRVSKSGRDWAELFPVTRSTKDNICSLDPESVCFSCVSWRWPKSRKTSVLPLL